MRPFRPWHIVAILTMAVLTASHANAHAVGAECKLNANRVDLEAFYDDDTPARSARIQVENADKTVVAEGRTDAEGRWTFARPKPGRYVVHVDAGAGHRTKLTVTIPTADPPTPAPADANVPEPSVTVSDGRDRADFTRFPWSRIAVGLAVIAGLGLAMWSWRRGRGADDHSG